METLNESTSAEQRFFLSVQFQKRKIQTVFLCFRNIRLVKNLLLSALARISSELPEQQGADGFASAPFLYWKFLN